MPDPIRAAARTRNASGVACPLLVANALHKRGAPVPGVNEGLTLGERLVYPIVCEQQARRRGRPQMRLLSAADIVRRRQAIGISQVQLAHLVGLAVPTLCRVERGKFTASSTTLARVDAILRVYERAHREAHAIRSKAS